MRDKTIGRIILFAVISLVLNLIILILTLIIEKLSWIPFIILISTTFLGWMIFIIIYLVNKNQKTEKKEPELMEDDFCKTLAKNILFWEYYDYVINPSDAGSENRGESGKDKTSLYGLIGKGYYKPEITYTVIINKQKSFIEKKMGGETFEFPEEYNVILNADLEYIEKKKEMMAKNPEKQISITRFDKETGLPILTTKTHQLKEEEKETEELEGDKK